MRFTKGTVAVIMSFVAAFISRPDIAMMCLLYAIWVDMPNKEQF